MYKLYYSPGTCSMAPHIALLECHQAVTLEKIDLATGQNRTPEYLKINPRGSVPVLVDGEQTIREGAAILIHILEKNKSPLLPSNGTARDTALEWLMFCNATLHPAYSRAFFLKKNNGDDAIMDSAVAMINKLWAGVEDHLASSTYLAGNDVTIADILMSVIAGWNKNIPKPIVIGERTKALIQKVIERPAYKKALEVEQVEYKMAA